MMIDAFSPLLLALFLAVGCSYWLLSLMFIFMLLFVVVVVIITVAVIASFA